jgi:hypothetical protein
VGFKVLVHTLHNLGGRHGSDSAIAQAWRKKGVAVATEGVGQVMNSEHNRSRILFIDGLRGIAVSAVILFRYFSRWTPPMHYENLYPYGDLFLPLFKYGFSQSMVRA